MSEATADAIRALAAGDLVLGLESPVPANVEHLDASAGEYPRDEEAAVAVGRVLLAEDHRDPGAGRLVDQSGDAGGEEVARSQTAVEDVSLVVVELVLGGAAAELLAEVDVPDIDGGQGSLEVVRALKCGA